MKRKNNEPPPDDEMKPNKTHGKSFVTVFKCGLFRILRRKELLQPINDVTVGAMLASEFEQQSREIKELAEKTKEAMFSTIGAAIDKHDAPAVRMWLESMREETWWNNVCFESSKLFS